MVSSIDFHEPGPFTRLMRCGLLAILLGGTAAAGCAHKEFGALHQPFNPAASTAPPPAPAPSAAHRPIIVTPDTGLAGKVIKVNPGGRFVVLNFPVGHLPALDQRFNVYHQGLKVGEVKISGPQLEDDIVGDLVSGGAEVGDEVRD